MPAVSKPCPKIIKSDILEISVKRRYCVIAVRNYKRKHMDQEKKI